MKVFISWSGEESRQIAEALRDWLPALFESVEPYMSVRDNEAGVRWSSVISGELEGSDFGILCLTPSNLQAPWLLFEAGALSKAVETARVVPLLWRLSPSDVTSPLNQFHMKSADEAGIRNVVESINGTLDRARPDQALAAVFKGLWPQLQDALNAVSAPDQPEAPHRKDRELLEEILELVRNTSQTVHRPRIPIPTGGPAVVLTSPSEIEFMETIGNAIGSGARIERKATGGYVITVKDRRKANRAQHVLKEMSNLVAHRQVEIRFADPFEDEEEQ
ncbi:toll/interleukin-1 receptor domain-containing protein [Blastococcus sp. PRF04-17]|uniref:toll/interleukin-1 receptor domain-containing protein n=1 Tax=Blastococcus sp. PRF04-17 TaxID=2933797 RepID=UPI001FF10569|nr:toll/interleukin-1 receptor domain-containing protein [Blastococcus sp. PRF04-17]UOY03135.1 toll/interleukin-1 receptor domain-containing protein [Blastococcus sp. PRF04-17]